jgi:hypothetical protein
MSLHAALIPTALFLADQTALISELQTVRFMTVCDSSYGVRMVTRFTRLYPLAVLLKTAVFWDVTHCLLLHISRLSTGFQCIHLDFQTETFETTGITSDTLLCARRLVSIIAVSVL